MNKVGPVVFAVVIDPHDVNNVVYRQTDIFTLFLGLRGFKKRILPLKTILTVHAINEKVKRAKNVNENEGDTLPNR